MATTKARRTNERFYDAYLDFDDQLCELMGVEKDGVQAYRMRMKEAWYEAKELIPEWESIDQRLEVIRERYQILKQGKSKFDDVHGKDEDVVWIRIFISKIESKADPLSKYKNLNFTYKKRKKSLIQIILDMFK